MHPGDYILGGGAAIIAVLSLRHQIPVHPRAGEQHQQHAQGKHREHQHRKQVRQFCCIFFHESLSNTVISGIRLEANTE